MTPRAHQRTSPQPTAPQAGNGNHHQASDTQPNTTGTDPSGTDSTGTDPTGAEGTRIDPETFRRWRQITSAMPPMTPEEIAATGLILRRIDARRNARHDRPATQ